MQRRREHRKHRFVGEVEGVALTDWLNRWRRKKQGQSVIQLVNDFNRLDQALREDVANLLDRKFAESRRSESRRATVGLSDLQPDREYVEIARRADRLLSQCSMRPRLIEHARTMEFGWRYASALSEGLHLVVAIAQMGLLHSISTCANDNCGIWFFKKFPQQKFCPKGKCEAEHRTTESGKKHRREIHRRRYQSRKALGRI